MIILWFLAHGCDFKNAGTFSQGIFYSQTHICIFAPVHALLEYARTLGFGPMLLRWRPNLWGFSATFAFCTKAPRLANFLLHLRTTFLEAHLLSPSKIWQLWMLKNYKVSWDLPLPLLHPNTLPFHRQFAFFQKPLGISCFVRLLIHRISALQSPRQLAHIDLEAL